MQTTGYKGRAHVLEDKLIMETDLITTILTLNKLTRVQAFFVTVFVLQNDLGLLATYFI